jgi:hypothetical protein
MAQLNNTFSSFDAKGNRESLADWIDNATPTETPLYSNIGTQTSKAKKEEWQTDTNRVPDPDNARVEGDTYTFDTRTPSARVGNYHQIFSERFVISASQEAVESAGRASEVAYQKMKAGQTLKTDIEAAFLSNSASVAGSDSVASRLGGLRAWCATNDSMGSGGSSGGYNSSTGVVDAAVNGTQRAFTKTLLDENIQSAYINGGAPDVLMVSPYVKSVFSTFMSDTDVAQQRYAASANSQSTIVGAADAYLSDFGLIDVVPNRQMVRATGLARNAFLIDRSKLAKSWLRKIQEDKDVAKTSDGIPVVMNAEVTLVVKNEANLGVIADLYGTSASS